VRAVGARGERDVEPVVDQHVGAPLAADRHQLVRLLRQFARRRRLVAQLDDPRPRGDRGERGVALRRPTPRPGPGDDVDGDFGERRALDHRRFLARAKGRTIGA